MLTRIGTSLFYDILERELKLSQRDETDIFITKILASGLVSNTSNPFLAYRIVADRIKHCLEHTLKKKSRK